MLTIVCCRGRETRHMLEIRS